MEGVLPITAALSPIDHMASTKTFGAGADVDAAAQDFEAMFATQMLQPMFQTVPVNSTFGGGNGEEVMRTFMLQEYGKLVAKSGLLGIASQVKAEMLRAQEDARTQSMKTADQGAQTAPASALTQTKETSHVPGA